MYIDRNEAIIDDDDDGDNSKLHQTCVAAQKYAENIAKLGMPRIGHVSICAERVLALVDLAFSLFGPPEIPNGCLTWVLGGGWGDHCEGYFEIRYSQGEWGSSCQNFPQCDWQGAFFIIIPI